MRMYCLVCLLVFIITPCSAQTTYPWMDEWVNDLSHACVQALRHNQPRLLQSYYMNATTIDLLLHMEEREQSLSEESLAAARARYKQMQASYNAQISQSFQHIHAIPPYQEISWRAVWVDSVSYTPPTEDGVIDKVYIYLDYPDKDEAVTVCIVIDDCKLLGANRFLLGKFERKL